jgi:hypothetical protein
LHGGADADAVFCIIFAATTPLTATPIYGAATVTMQTILCL